MHLSQDCSLEWTIQIRERVMSKQMPSQPRHTTNTHFNLAKENASSILSLLRFLEGQTSPHK